MHILLTGGTGYIGGAVLDALTAKGHDVTVAVRSEEAARRVAAKGARAVIGDITDPAWFGALLREADGSIHSAAGGAAMDAAVLDAVIDAFGGTGKPFVHTGGVWSWGSGTDIDEADPQNPPALTAWRQEQERRILDSDVKASLVAPGIVYGYGIGIPVSVIADAPRDEHGALRLVGDGTQHWATVHVDDLADLYVRVLEHAPGGGTYIGASGISPTVRELAEAAAGAGGAVAPETAEETRARLGAAFADALLLDQQASGRRAKETFGWAPSRPSILHNLQGAADDDEAA
ncbi:NAD-dependent epimerase/dehydratase family protein [Naasia sp. SYSU D00057]|uniref:NAD-dependent epimerase/dehydratase family protein n=1 Tax=Naasia sp. SYSU D00057 TaxID=2817380 RepID=UPI001B3034F9|nr:NAD-dependent epimerase/dehydratase family protein [Naasia sp. SYSU D00057]